MRKLFYFFSFIMCLTLMSCKQKGGRETKSDSNADFLKEMVEFVPFDYNPLFSGTNSNTWDQHIRERGFILFEDSIYKMWYTGYMGGDNDPKFLGYATSKDGINWSRYAGNPIFKDKWTEDMFVVKYEGKYYMYAEGKKDIAHLLISEDGINWKEQGNLIILTVKGDTIPPPYGTPSVFIENGKWHLFYERNDEAIWLAVSNDHKTWTNVNDEPVLKKGPGTYDSGAVASNQVVKFKGKYYMFYHGSANANWDKPGVSSVWSSNVAMSSDLVHWVKYSSNPIAEGDHSSPILVFDGSKYRLYTMHDKVWLYFPE